LRGCWSIAGDRLGNWFAIFAYALSEIELFIYAYAAEVELER
jgi:hypothetical protein